MNQSGAGKFKIERVTRSAHEQIADYLREEIATGNLKAGEKLAATKQLAAQWKTHATTVHRAMGLLVKEGMLVRMLRKGTFVREREKRLARVAVYGEPSFWEAPEVHALEEALREELNVAGIELDLWVDTRSPEERAEVWPSLAKAAAERRFQFLIGIGTDLPRLKWQKELAVPVIFVEAPKAAAWMERKEREMARSLVNQAQRQYREESGRTILTNLKLEARAVGGPRPEKPRKEGLSRIKEVPRRVGAEEGRTVALMTTLDILHPGTSRYFSYMFSELGQFFSAAGFRTRLFIGKGRPGVGGGAHQVYEDVAACAAKGEIAGVVALNTSVGEWSARLTELKIPVLGDLPSFPYSVSLPYQEWMRRAVGHLVAQGRRRLALLYWGPEQDKTQGNFLPFFRNELQRHGLMENPEWVQGNFHPCEEGAGWSELREIWTSRREKPNGLVIADDFLAPEACVALRELGVAMPEQLAAVTYANAGCPMHLTLPAARLEYDTVSHARVMGKFLLQIIRGEAVSKPRIYGKAEFRLQEGTKPRRSAMKKPF